MEQTWPTLPAVNLLPNGSFETFVAGPPYMVPPWEATNIALSAGESVLRPGGHSVRVTKTVGASYGFLSLSAAALLLPDLFKAVLGREVSLRCPINCRGTTSGLIVATITANMGAEWVAAESPPIPQDDQSDTWQYLDIPGFYVPTECDLLQISIVFPDVAQTVLDMDGVGLVMGGVPHLFP